jgi:hypothetical protein
MFWLTNILSTHIKFLWHNRTRAASLLRYLGRTQTHYTSTTPLDEGSACRRDIWQQSQLSQQTDINSPAGFEPVIPVSERPQTHALNRAATDIGLCTFASINYTNFPRTQRVFVHSLLHSKKAVKQMDVPDSMSCIFQLFVPKTARDCFCISTLITRQ